MCVGRGALERRSMRSATRASRANASMMLGDIYLDGLYYITAKPKVESRKSSTLSCSGQAFYFCCSWLVAWRVNATIRHLVIQPTFQLHTR